MAVALTLAPSASPSACQVPSLAPATASRALCFDSAAYSLALALDEPATSLAVVGADEAALAALLERGTCCFRGIVDKLIR